MALGQLRAPISLGKSNSYAESSGRILTDPTGERRNRQFCQHFRGLRSCQPNPSGESGLIGVCSGFLSVAYRRTGSRGPAGRLLYDARRVDPAAWLAERIGPVTILGEAAVDAAPAVAARRCGWIIDTSGDVVRKCGELIRDGLEL